MLMREKVRQIIKDAASQLVKDGGFSAGGESALGGSFEVSYPEAKFGDYATNAALALAKPLKGKPQDVAKSLVEKIDKSIFESVEIAGPGFINFKLKSEELIKGEKGIMGAKGEKILVEYFQPNIAKPMHIGLLRTAMIGDSISRMLKFLGHHVESDTHMGDWGTQFGFLILAYKKYGDNGHLRDATDPIDELNKLYVRINAEAETDESVREVAKQEFVKLEQGDEENRKIWKQFVDWSMDTFMTINSLMDIQAFDHHWPESFYEDKMPSVLEKLKAKGILKESQGAQIVDLSAGGGSASGGENSNLGIAVVVKSDGGTTYLLRDIATFIYRKSLGFAKQIYVVDNRQSHAFRQLFAILSLMDEIEEGEGLHVDYGFISFKGEALSTRKGNMVLAKDVIAQAEEKVAQIIQEKNPELAGKEEVIKSVAKGALKYFDLSHNRHSDIEFDWQKVLDFEGDSGPYLQYSYARLASILRKAGSQGEVGSVKGVAMTPTERELLFKLSILPEVVEDALKDYLPNVLANYLYNLAGLINKFYHESPVIAEKDETVRAFRLWLIQRAKVTLAQGLDLLGIKVVDEM